MKTMTRIFAPVLLATSALVATAPAVAQVQGPVASLDLTRTVLGSNALSTAYTEINQAYTQQTEQIRTKSEQRQAILRNFDSNRDNQIDDNELATAQRSPQFAQAQTLEEEITQLTNQVNAARVFAIEQILEQVSPSLQQVVTDKKIRLVLDPSAVLFSPPEADITEAVVNVLNTRLPRVAITPSQGWQPSRQGVQLFQEMQQLLMTASAMQRQQQQAQQPQGSAEAPVGR
jgi:Skp family chaperone for outer membrane proteins